MPSTRPPYPSDVSDAVWAFVAPYLTMLAEDAGQHKFPLREVFNGLRFIVKTDAHLRMLPHDVPPRPTGYQQMLRRMAVDCFEAVAHDLRVLLRRAAERDAPQARPPARCGP